MPVEGVLLTGIIDLALLEEDGWSIIDFKSHQVEAEQVPALAEHFLVQGTCYAWALAELTGRPVRNFGIFGVLPGVLAWSDLPADPAASVRGWVRACQLG
jgi:hypothetical protein